MNLRPLFLLLSLLLAVTFSLQSLPDGDWVQAGTPHLQESERKAPAISESGPSVTKTAARSKTPPPPDPEAIETLNGLAMQMPGFIQHSANTMALASPVVSHTRPAPRAPPSAA